MVTISSNRQWFASVFSTEDSNRQWFACLLTTANSNREAGSIAVLSQHYAPMGPDSIPSLGVVSAFGFKFILASAGFSPGPAFFHPAFETVFLK